MNSWPERHHWKVSQAVNLVNDLMVCHADSTGNLVSSSSDVKILSLGIPILEDGVFNCQFETITVLHLFLQSLETCQC